MAGELLVEVIRELASARDRREVAAIVVAAVHRGLKPETTAVLETGPAGRCLSEQGAALSVERQMAVQSWLHELQDHHVIERADLGSIHPSFAAVPSVATLAIAPIRRATQLGALVVMFGDARSLTTEERSLLEGLAAAAALAFDDFAAVAALSASEERYRSLVENLEDLVFSLDQAGDFTYVSPSIQKYGFTPEEFCGASFTRFIVPEDLPALLASLVATLGGELKPTFFRAVSKSGAIHHVRTLSRPIFEQGQPVGVTGVMVDITELRRAEEKLRMSQKMDAIGQLAGGVAHDFNNLLAVILSYSTFAFESLGEGDPRREDLREVIGSARRGASLTKQLLTFGRREPQKVELLDLNKVALDLQKMLARLIGENVQLELNLAPQLGLIKGDRGQLEQVVLNLVLNARDAMPSGGKVVIATQELQDDRAWVFLRVSDEGCGMDETTQRRIFEPFFTTKGNKDGTGLGLSTVYGIVQQSEGVISVESAPDRGTTFTVQFPRSTEQTAPEALPRNKELPKLATERVLLVESEEPVRKLTARILKAAGYELLIAASAGEALLLVESSKQPIELLVTDVHMPLLDGPQLAQRIRALSSTLPKVLFVSGYVATEGVQTTPQSDFLAKPFLAEDLLRAVRELLEG